MWFCEDKLKGKTSHFRLRFRPSVSQKKGKGKGGWGGGGLKFTAVCTNAAVIERSFSQYMENL